MGEVKFNLKEPTSENDTLVQLLFRYNNERLKYSTGQKIHPAFWNELKQRAKETKKFPGYSEFNSWLDHLESLVKELFRRYMNDHHAYPTAEELKVILNNTLRKTPSSEKMDLLQFIEHFIEQSRMDKSPKTIGWHKMTLKRLREYQTKTGSKLDFDTLDMDFYYGFTEYLTKDLNHATNTIAKHIQNIKAFMNEATERGLNRNMTFKSKKFRKITEESENIFLNKDELQELYDLDLSKHPRLEKVRDLFLVGCWTGLRFSDFSNIQPKNISSMTLANGKKAEVLDIRTKKTGEAVVIPLFPIVKSIMEKYKGKYPNSLPPAISNVKMNLYLKELGAKLEKLLVEVEISKTIGKERQTIKYKKHELITTHTARRSFATNLFLDGYPPDWIMGITGHKSQQSFYKYIKATPREKAKLLHMHWYKLEENEIKEAV